MVTIFWTFQAEEDLKDIYKFIAKGSIKYAHIQVRKIKTATHILKNNPKAGKLVPENNLTAVREIIEGNYRIIYLVVNQTRIDMLLVQHEARSIEKRINK